MSNELALNKSERLDALAKRGEIMLAQVQALEVKDESGRAIAAELREQARIFIKGVKDDWKGETGEVTVAFRLYKSLLARVDKAIDFPEKVMKIAEGKMNTYLLEEDRKHREAQAKIDAETAERDRKEKERLDKLAEKQLEAGKFDKAQETIDRAEAVYTPPPILPSLDKTVKTDAGGTSSRKDFDIIVDNPSVFIQQIILGGGNFGFIEFKNGPIKRYAEGKRVGDNLPVIPGCRITAKFGFSGRAK